MEWRPFVNAVLYVIQFDRTLDDEAVRKVVHTMLGNPFFDSTPEEEYAALSEALRSGERLTGGIPQPHGEDAVQQFLPRVLGGLDERRPWPEPAFRRIDISEWHRFGDAQPIARVHVWFIKAQERLKKVFQRIDSGRDVLLLRLSSGVEVALVTPWWSGSDDLALLLKTPDVAPRRVIDEFTSAAGFGPEEVTPLT